MRILTVLKRYNKLFAIIVTIGIIAIYLVIALSGKYLKERIYRDDNVKQPVNNIKSVDDDVFSYEFTEDKTMGNYIYMINQFPITDEVGRELEGKLKTFDFKLKFNGQSKGIKYQITLEKMDGSDLQDNWVKVYLENEGREVSDCIRSTGRIKTYNEYSKYNGKNDERILYSGFITDDDIKRGYKNYTFRMWVSEDVKVVNEEYEKNSFIARVNVHANGSF